MCISADPIHLNHSSNALHTDIAFSMLKVIIAAAAAVLVLIAVVSSYISDYLKAASPLDPKSD